MNHDIGWRKRLRRKNERNSRAQDDKNSIHHHLESRHPSQNQGLYLSAIILVFSVIKCNGEETKCERLGGHFVTTSYSPPVGVCFDTDGKRIEL